MSSLGQAIGRSDSCIPCYSTQSIEELLGARDEKKRTGLNLQLDVVGAKCLETISDSVGGMPTGHRITVKNREERTQIYKDMQNLSSVGGFGLGDLLQKFIGGIDSISFDDVSKMALADLDQLLDFDVSEFPPELAATVMGAAEEMKEKARKAQYDLTEQLNRENDIRLQQLDTARINNFVGTGAVDQIIEAENFHEGTSVMVEEFLKQPPRIPSKRADAHLGSPSWEQVYRLAQLLFLLSVVRVFGTNGGLI